MLVGTPKRSSDRRTGRITIAVARKNTTKAIGSQLTDVAQASSPGLANGVAYEAETGRDDRL